MIRAKAIGPDGQPQGEERTFSAEEWKRLKATYPNTPWQEVTGSVTSKTETVVSTKDAVKKNK